MPLLQFVPFATSIDPTFWHALTNLKIDVLKLSEEPVPVKASYERGRWVTDRETGSEIGVGGELRLDGKAFEKDVGGVGASSSGRVVMHGLLKVFNTIEDFRNADKQALFNTFSDTIWASSSNSESPKFLAIAFADLKKYKYYYWFAFPAFVAKPGWETVAEEGWTMFGDEGGLGAKLAEVEEGLKGGAWIAKKASSGWKVGKAEDWKTFFDGVDAKDRHLIFIDPSAHPQAAGWPLRNLLAFVHKAHGEEASSFKVVAWRDAIGTHVGAVEVKKQSLVADVKIAAQEAAGGVRPSAVGWEKNTSGKLAPRLADLGPMMDPIRLADQAVDLNLKLMRWRILPSLDLEKIASTKCLLLGAGTLGCYVSRTLMAWGVRKITFVDSAKVSFSNPVRQPLFEFTDCLEGGKAKAACAADALKRIYPNVDATGIDLAIPMPGHPIPAGLVDKAKADVKILEDLFDAHDVVYLLMDSRESRWLPTVLGAAKRKLVMNAALGFDSYLVMRHGVASSSSKTASATQAADSVPAKAIEGRLGCYYCNDIVAPTDSLTDRTLDQMCTVTRPGLAAIASATAVEMMASVLQHPKGIEALSDVPIHTKDGSKPIEEDASASSVLGQVPHQIRGFLARFENMKLTGPAYDKCTGCSDTIVSAYQTQGFDMLIKAFNDAKYLEQVTGLDKLYAEGEAALENVDWEEDDDDAGSM